MMNNDGWSTETIEKTKTVPLLCEPIDLKKELKPQFVQKITDALCAWKGDEGLLTAKSLIEFLEKTDFFVAPASTKYHEAYEGGLLEHSCKVGNIAISMMDNFPFNQQPLSYSQVWICTLLHDVCKADFYETYDKNVKNPNTGRWETVQAYRVRENRDAFLGHGEHSAIAALRLIPYLTISMLEAIRWHSGLWDCSDSGNRDYASACSKHPIVHLIQFADLLSCSDWVTF